MIAAALLLTAQVAGLPDDPRARAVAARLQRIRLSTRVDREGRMTRCDVRRSSGDPAFDAAACRVTRSCAELGQGTRETTDACVREQLLKAAVAEEFGK